MADYAEPPLRTYDERLCAAVIADAFTGPFSDAALEALPPVKLLFFRPEIEDVIKAEFHVSRVVRILKRRGDFSDPEEIVVPNANLYAFIAPVPEAIARTVPEFADDPEGFDRVAFHDEMNRAIVAFFKQAFTDCAT